MKTISKSDWRRKLHKGDEVTWTDPDGGLCSRKEEIVAIRYLAEDMATITWIDGTTTEVFLREIS